MKCTHFKCIAWLLLLFIYLFILVFLGLHLWHVDVSRLGVTLNLLLPAYARVTGTRDPSYICDLQHSSRQCRCLTHWAKPGIKPASSQILVGVINRWAQRELPAFSFFLSFFFFFFFDEFFKLFWAVPMAYGRSLAGIKLKPQQWPETQQQQHQILNLLSHQGVLMNFYI